MDLENVECEGYIGSGQGAEAGLLDTVGIFGFHKRRGVSWSVLWLPIFQGLCSVKLELLVYTFPPMSAETLKSIARKAQRRLVTNSF
jgi:hypothetical protein